MSSRTRRGVDKSMAPAVVRRLLGWPQIRVAVFAGTGVGSVRLYELDPFALSTDKRRALDWAYSRMRELYSGGSTAEAPKVSYG